MARYSCAVLRSMERDRELSEANGSFMFGLALRTVMCFSRLDTKCRLSQSAGAKYGVSRCQQSKVRALARTSIKEKLVKCTRLSDVTLSRAEQMHPIILPLLTRLCALDLLGSCLPVCLALTETPDQCYFGPQTFQFRKDPCLAWGSGQRLRFGRCGLS